MTNQVIIPLLNPNEPEALLAALHVMEGQQVTLGEALCTLETTKTTAELMAEASGYVAGLRFRQGETVRAGDLLCYLADSADWQPPIQEESTQPSTQAEAIPEGVRITQPALAKARQLGINLDELPVGTLITENYIRTLAGKGSKSQFTPPNTRFDPLAMIVYGGGGHGKSLIELIRTLSSYRIVGVVDDGIPTGQEILGVPVLGGAQVLEDLYQRGVRLAANAVGGIGDLAVRIKIFERIARAGFTCPVLVHPRSFIEASAVLAPGVQVFPHAYVGSDVEVGFGTIVNTGAIVSHDCMLGNYVNISPGAILAGGVQVGDGALIGMGATVNLLANIGRGVRIGNGATVKSDVPEGGLVRAGRIYPE
jgi:sugar O-acyltransferase (sialic acid O-acetyltransferase NeuD family)